MATNSITLNDLEMYTNDKTYIGYYKNVHEMESRNDEENDEFIIELPKGCELTKDDFEQRECFRIVMQNYIIKAKTIKVKFGDEEYVDLITYKKDNKKNREIDYFYYDNYCDYENLFECYDEGGDNESENTVDDEDRVINQGRNLYVLKNHLYLVRTEEETLITIDNLYLNLEQHQLVYYYFKRLQFLKMNG